MGHGAKPQLGQLLASEGTECWAAPSSHKDRAISDIEVKIEALLEAMCRCPLVSFAETDLSESANSSSQAHHLTAKIERSILGHT